MTELNGKVALITGALGGIGQWYAKALLDNKIKGLALWDINETAAQKFLDELEKKYGTGKAIFVKVDVSKNKEIQDGFEKTVKHFRQLDIVVNNAGILEEVDIEKCIQVNLVAVTVITNLAMFKFLPTYRQGKEGIVVNTASLAGLGPSDFMPTYSITKQGVVAIGRCLGMPAHYESTKVRVLTICPGTTETPLLEREKELPDSLRAIKDEFYKKNPFFENQSADLLGTALIKVVQEGKTGSIWLVWNGKPAKEIDYTCVDQAITSQFL